MKGTRRPGTLLGQLSGGVQVLGGHPAARHIRSNSTLASRAAPLHLLPARCTLEPAPPVSASLTGPPQRPGLIPVPSHPALLRSCKPVRKILDSSQTILVSPPLTQLLPTPAREGQTSTLRLSPPSPSCLSRPRASVPASLPASHDRTIEQSTEPTESPPPFSPSRQPCSPSQQSRSRSLPVLPLGRGRGSARQPGTQAAHASCVGLGQATARRRRSPRIEAR